MAYHLVGLIPINYSIVWMTPFNLHCGSLAILSQAFSLTLEGHVWVTVTYSTVHGHKQQFVASKNQGLLWTIPEVQYHLLFPLWICIACCIQRQWRKRSFSHMQYVVSVEFNCFFVQPPKHYQSNGKWLECWKDITSLLNFPNL